MTTTPILFLVFKRLDTTQKVFDAIRKARPSRLYVAADGPRADREGEAEQCARVRQVATAVDWPCEVQTLFRDENLGCGTAIISAITWFFEHEAEGIILEDDCVPDASFFPFIEEMLERYRDDSRVHMVGGSNFQFGRQSFGDSYYFSRYCHVWGWATWRRTWEQYDPKIEDWPQMRDERRLRDVFQNAKAVRYWTKRFQATYDGDPTVFDYQLFYSAIKHNKVAVIPNRNLVANIGFGVDASHTSYVSEWDDMPTQPMAFPLRHPRFMVPDLRADVYTEANQFGRRSVWKKIHDRLAFRWKLLPDPHRALRAESRQRAL